MLNKLLLCFTLILLAVEVLSAQIGTAIPANRRVDWRNVGIPGGIPNKYTRVFNIKAEYMDQGMTADQAITAALTAASSYSGLKVLYFPSGTYSISSLTVPNNIVIKGDGADLTTIIGNANNNIFRISGSAGSIISNISTYDQGTKTITLQSANGEIETGDFVEIVMQNGPYHQSFPDWQPEPLDYVGQIVKVEMKISASSYVLTDDISLTWNSGGTNPRVRKVNPAQNIGFEDVKIQKSSGGQSNFSFYYAANCWLRGVDSYKPGRHHVTITKKYGNRSSRFLF